MVSIPSHLAAGKMKMNFYEETRKPGSMGKNSWLHGFLIMFFLAAVGLRGADYDAQFNKWFEVQTNLQSWAGDFTQTRTLTVLNQPLVSHGKVWVRPGMFFWAAVGLRGADYDAQFNKWFEVQTNLLNWAS